MTDFTDEDVQRGAEAIADYVGEERFGYEPHARVVLAAVLPAYTARVLREAADAWSIGLEYPRGATIWLHARADAEESK